MCDCSVVRPEREQDRERVERLIRDAFWDVCRPGCNEHLIVHRMRGSACFVPELNVVAESDGRIVGHAICSRAQVETGCDKRFEVLCFGPLAVSSEFRCRGIGSALIKYLIGEAGRMGFRAMVLFGNPDYYGKFGFRDARHFGITTSSGENFAAFMAMELKEGALKNISGRFFEDAVFHVTDEETERFDRRFPFREKRAAQDNERF